MPDIERPVTPAEFREQMKLIFPASGYDGEGAHAAGDRLMMAVLKTLGYGKGVEIFKKADKWYA